MSDRTPAIGTPAIAMLDMQGPMPHAKIRSLARFGLTTADAPKLSNFYQNALGFRVLGVERRSGPDFTRLMGVESGALAIILGLGDEVIELQQFDRPGRSYPGEATSSDLCFQHFAIVVADMQLAHQKLVSVPDWTAISTDGPQQLPASSGGVTAFKFRDPDGHPLELLAFPNGKLPALWQARSTGNLSLGIDHSAISVSDSADSIAFYEGLGLRVTARSLNTGPAQERLDAIRADRVEVTALAPEKPTPHLELLCYRAVKRNGFAAVRSDDVAATRLVFEADRPSLEDANAPQGLLDLDGHRLIIAAPASASDTGLSQSSTESEYR